MIEIKKPTGLTNLKYIENDVSNADFSNLLSNPVVLIPAVTNKTIFPIAVSIQYTNIIATASGYAIGPKSILQSLATVAFGPMYVLGSNINGISGTLFLGNTNTNNLFATSGAPNTPIVFF